MEAGQEQGFVAFYREQGGARGLKEAVPKHENTTVNII